MSAGPYPLGVASGASVRPSLISVRFNAKQVWWPLATCCVHACATVGVCAPAGVASTDADAAISAIAAPPTRTGSPLVGTFTLPPGSELTRIVPGGRLRAFTRGCARFVPLRSGQFQPRTKLSVQGRIPSVSACQRGDQHFRPLRGGPGLAQLAEPGLLSALR